MGLLIIPCEVLQYIFSYLDEGSQAITHQVCKRFDEVIGKREFKISWTQVGCSLPIFRWALMNEFPVAQLVDEIDIFTYYSVEVIKYIMNKMKFTYDISFAGEKAAENGRIDLLRLLISGELGMKLRLSPNLMRKITLLGKMDLVRVMRDGSLGDICPWDSDTTLSAAMKGHNEILKVLRNGSLGGVCRWDSTTCDMAAYYGHLDTLIMLRNGSFGEKCPWDKEHCLEYSEDYPEIVAEILSGRLD